MKTSGPSLGVILGNRDFFPDKLVAEARAELVKLFRAMGLAAVMLGAEDTKLGGVETHADARKCAALFRQHRDELGGILVVLPNFGDERAVADTLKLAGLDVPVLVQGYPDELDRLDVVRRRDAFCGKISVCNNLRQAGMPFSLTQQHVVAPHDPSFRADLERFLAVCRVVRGVRRARLGAVGARPGAFNTVRYSEKILERHGISVTTVDLSEILGQAGKLGDTRPPRAGQDRRDQGLRPDRRRPGRRNSCRWPGSAWCWTTSWLSNAPRRHRHPMLDLPAAELRLQRLHQHEHDERELPAQRLRGGCHRRAHHVRHAAGLGLARARWSTGTTTTARTRTSASCSTAATGPSRFLPDIKVGTAPILGTTLGVENTYGALDGRTPAGPLTFGRVTTDDSRGVIRAYVGEGALTNDELRTFGTRAVARVPHLQKLLRYVCSEGFEHHVVMNASRTAGVLAEAFGRYLGWEVYHHEPGEE